MDLKQDAEQNEDERVLGNLIDTLYEHNEYVRHQYLTMI